MTLTHKQKAKVVRGLRQGLGVEDIAVTESLLVDSVRFYVRFLSHSGVLAGIYKDMRREMANA